MLERIFESVERAVKEREVPGAVALVGTRDGAPHLFAGGVTRFDAPKGITPDTLFDLASLTKVVSTLPAVLKLVSAGEVRLDDPLGRFFPNAGWFQTPTIRDVSVRSLLTHTSGLPAWKPLFAWVSERRTAVANVLQTSLEHPAGQYVYSDLGFMILGILTERVTGMRQDSFVEGEIFGPLGMRRTGYRPISEHLESDPSIAATEDCGWRFMVLQGTVHDENAFVMDGVAGHAGLFGTAEDLGFYARAWLEFGARLGSEDLLREAVSEHFSDGEVRRGLGWLLQGGGSSVGIEASDRAFGHTGFTGTSLWIDPVAGWYAILLTNRVHPSREGGGGIRALRVKVHEAVSLALVNRGEVEV